MARRARRRQWLEFVGMAGFGLLLTVGGLAGGIGTNGSDRGASLTVAAFGGALLTGSPMFWPRRGIRLRQDVVQVGDREERGVSLPWAVWATACVVVSSVFFTLACLGLVLYGDVFTRGLHRYAWAAQLVGVVGVVFFGVGGVFLAVRGVGRPWRVVLVPSGVLVQRGGVRTFVAWPAVTDPRVWRIRAPYGAREPVITIGDVTIPIRALDVESSLLPRALRFYRANPEARPELGTKAGLNRIRSGDLG